MAAKNLLDRIAKFKGTGPDGLIHNWLSVPSYTLPGTPFGVTVDLNSAPVGLDLSLLKEILPDLEVKDVGVIAEQGFGKTFAVMYLLLLWSGLDTGTNKVLKFWFNSLKQNKQGGRRRPETASLVEDLMKCKLISPWRIKLNPLSRIWDMTFDEKYVLAVRIYQYLLNQVLSLEAKNVLRDVLEIIESDITVDPSFPALYEALRAYNPVPTDYEFDVPSSTLSPRQQLRKEQLDGNYKRLSAAAFELEMATKEFNGGLYGSMFSGTSSDFLEQLNQRAVSFDMKGVSDELRSIIEIVMSAITAAASTPWPHDDSMKPRHPEWVPDVIVTDEAYSDWENAEFVRNEYTRMKTQRETGIIGIKVFHRLRDFFEAIGNDKTGRQARNAINEIKVWLIGRQNKDALDDIRSFFTLPEYVVLSLPSLPKGHFWLILPGMPPLEIVVIGSETAIEAFSTDGANSQLLKRYFETGETRFYIQYLEETTPNENNPADEDDDPEGETDAIPATASLEA